MDDESDDEADDDLMVNTEKVFHFFHSYFYLSKLSNYRLLFFYRE